MKNKMKKETAAKLKRAAYIIAIILGVAFLAVIAFRQLIFPVGSFFYSLYDEEVASQLLVSIVRFAVVVDGCLLFSRVGHRLAVIGTKVKNRTAKTALLLVGNVAKYLSFILIFLLGLTCFGVDTTAVVTGAGVMTLVVSLGCQSMVSDIVAGIFMLFEGDIKVGDVVVINGWRGTVEQIGLRRTRIVDAVGNVNIINNSSISNIINNTQLLSVAIVDVGIEYGEDLKRVEEVLNEEFPVMKETIPAIVKGPYYKGVASLGESAVILRITADVHEEDKYQTERDINRAIKLAFDKHGINIPFNQVVVNYREEEGK